MTFTNIKNKEQGFTIVELLIVIIVIGILAALVLVGYNNVQAQARDTKRAANATTIRNALDTFKSTDDSGIYPTVDAGGNNFQTAIKGLTSNGTATNSLTVQPSVSSNLIVSGTPGNAAASPAISREAILVTWCGTNSPNTNANATGAKITYYKEVGGGSNPNTTTGTGC